MSKFLRMTSLAAAVATAALAATPAGAQVGPDPSSRNATATARVVKPLKLYWVQDLDLGTILQAGSGAYTESVGITHLGAFSCSGVNLVCSGTPRVARYRVTGTQGQVVTINAPDVTLTNQVDNLTTLLMTVDNPGTVTLGNSGEPGTPFALGGSIDVSNTTLDGTYFGTFNVTVNY
jgi:uncharacterized protein DUF4402